MNKAASYTAFLLLNTLLVSAGLTLGSLVLSAEISYCGFFGNFSACLYNADTCND